MVILLPRSLATATLGARATDGHGPLEPPWNGRVVTAPLLGRHGGGRKRLERRWGVTEDRPMREPSDESAGTPFEVACDESGSEGEHLIGANTDVFAHGSVHLAP